MRWDFRQQKIEHAQADEPTYRNPLFTKKTWQLFIIERFGFFSWLTVLIVLVLLYFFLYSPFFQITRVDIIGTERISAATLKTKFIEWQLNQKRGFIFKQSNIFLFNTTWLQNNIEQQYALEGLTIEKQFPHTIIVNVQEQKPSLIWQSGETSYFLDESGRISSIPEPATEPADFPVISDDSKTPVRPGETIMDAEKIIFMHQAINQMKEIHALEITGYRIANNLSTRLDAVTAAGYAIYFDMTKDLATQIAKLERVMAETVSDNPPHEYIDLRIGDRVYLK